jgi:AbrB family looped-hinge helix DNA binding protein
MPNYKVTKAMQAIELSVGRRGHIVIPRSMRQQLALEPGSQLLAHIEDGRLIMETKQQLWENIRTACQKVAIDRDLAQELIKERRQQAAQENQ